MGAHGSVGLSEFQISRNEMKRKNVKSFCMWLENQWRKAKWMYRIMHTIQFYHQFGNHNFQPCKCIMHISKNHKLRDYGDFILYFFFVSLSGTLKFKLNSQSIYPFQLFHLHSLCSIHIHHHGENSYVVYDFFIFRAIDRV